MGIAKKYVGIVCAAVFAFMFSSTSASAALDLTGVTFPLADVEAVAALILGAAAAIWVIYKVLTLIRRG